MKTSITFCIAFVCSLFTSNSRSEDHRSTQSPVAVKAIPTSVIDDGERILFVGNSYTANEGGVFNYLKQALKVSHGPGITTSKQIYYGKPLSAMFTPDVQAEIVSDKYDSVVITSDRIDVMKQFEAAIRESGKKTIVFVTWEGNHPGNRSNEADYTVATKRVVATMRQMQRETSATIVPAAVVYHDLTVRPPEGMPRVDYLWIAGNIHQNELGTMVNAWMFYAILTGRSPVNVDFDMPPFVNGEALLKTPEVKLTPRLRLELQQRVWEVAQAWQSGRTHLE